MFYVIMVCHCVGQRVRRNKSLVLFTERIYGPVLDIILKVEMVYLVFGALFVRKNGML